MHQSLTFDFWIFDLLIFKYVQLGYDFGSGDVILARETDDVRLIETVELGGRGVAHVEGSGDDTAFISVCIAGRVVDLLLNGITLFIIIIIEKY